MSGSLLVALSIAHELETSTPLDLARVLERLERSVGRDHANLDPLDLCRQIGWLRGAVFVEIDVNGDFLRVPHRGSDADPDYTMKDEQFGLVSLLHDPNRSDVGSRWTRPRSWLGVDATGHPGKTEGVRG